MDFLEAFKKMKDGHTCKMSDNEFFHYRMILKTHEFNGENLEIWEFQEKCISEFNTVKSLSEWGYTSIVPRYVDSEWEVIQ